MIHKKYQVSITLVALNLLIKTSSLFGIYMNSFIWFLPRAHAQSARATQKAYETDFFLLSQAKEKKKDVRQIIADQISLFVAEKLPKRRKAFDKIREIAKAAGKITAKVAPTVATAKENGDLIEACKEITETVIKEGTMLVEVFKNKSHVYLLNKKINYYPLNYTFEKGGWLIGHNTQTGKVYLCLNQKINGDWHTETQEIILENTYPFVKLENLIAKIIAGEYNLSEQVTHIIKT